MNYRSPGVRSTIIPGAQGALAEGTALLPVIVSSGPKRLETVTAITRGSSASDTLPQTSVESVSKISEKASGVATWVVDTDYTFSSADGTITWQAGKGPVEGSLYYVTLIYNLVDAEQFEPKKIYEIGECIAAYGEDLMLADDNSLVINPISLMVQIALKSGAKPVYAVQVPVAGASVTSNEYQTALDTHVSFIEDAWRVINGDVSSEINAVMLNHANSMSSVEERKERTAFFSTPYSGARPSTFEGDGGVLDIVGGYADSISDMRDVIVYPDRVKYTFSDGQSRTIDSQYINAAFAGMEMLHPVQTPRTRKNITPFTDLVGVKMRNSQKTALAAKGVTVLEQNNSGEPIKIRHGISTDMSTIQSKEMSILSVKDYISKVYRSSLDMYIGEIIDAALLRKIAATIIATSTSLVRAGNIRSALDPLVVQNADNPDTVDITISVEPLYPCNYIDIVIFFGADETTV